MAVPEPSVIVVTQSNLPTKRHPWQSYYVDLGEPQGDYVGQDYRQEHSPPTPVVGAFRNRNSPPYEPLFYLHHRVPLIYSGTTVNTKAVSPHFLFPRYEVWRKLLGILSASTFKHFVIIVLTVFLLLTRTTQGTEERRITQFTKLMLVRWFCALHNLLYVRRDNQRIKKTNLISGLYFDKSRFTNFLETVFQSHKQIL